MSVVSLLRTHNQQTNQPTTYVSIRVTVSHSMIDSIIRVLSNEDWYIIYPHYGKNKDNEHFHVLVPGSSAGDRERFRNAFKRASDLDVSGNKSISAKLQDNTVSCGIQYCSREGTDPYVKGDLVSEWICAAPKWVESTKVGKRKRDDDGVIKLTCVNHVQLAFEYWKKNNLHGDDLCEVVRRMLDTGEYMADANWMRQGAPDFLIDVFKESCEAGRLTWKAMSVRGGLWKPPRQTW